MATTPREPTAEECNTHSEVDGGYAIWYPSMGGYVSRAVAVKADGCLNLYIWHNGEFPFSGSISSRECWCWCGECPCCEDKVTVHPKPPIRVHHCDTKSVHHVRRNIE